MKFIELKSRLQLRDIQAVASEFKEPAASQTCNPIATDIMRQLELLNSILN